MTTLSQNANPLISIVDDEPRVRKSLGRFIRSAGYRTEEYDSAEDYLTRGWWEEPSCLILDVRLPAMSGLELQRYLAQQQMAHPIVFISARATENEHIWAVMKGAVAFLPKPFGLGTMLAAVRRAVSRASTRSPRLSLEQHCPLCHEPALVAGIPHHLMLDHVDVRSLAMGTMKDLNPSWKEQEGCCERCWRFYVGIGRVLACSLSREASSGHPAGNTKV